MLNVSRFKKALLDVPFEPDWQATSAEALTGAFFLPNWATKTPA
jgi:hypothetical protein